MPTLFLLSGALLAVTLSVRRWRRRKRVAAVLLAVGAFVLTALVSVALAVALVPVAGGVLWVRWRGARATMARWHARHQRGTGMATTRSLLWHSSSWAMRRKARVLRPSLASLSRRELWRVPVTEYAIPLARVGSFRAWIPIEDMIVVFGRPRRGKTGQVIDWLLDSPGPTLVTSTKRDLYDITHALRGNRGPTHVFNPTGLGNLPSTIAFDPLTECENTERAEERATDLISGASSGTSDGAGKRWEDQAQRVLTGLLHAAALTERGMTDVLRWVADPDTARREVLSALRRSPNAAAYVPAADQFFGTNDRTRSSITHTIMPCLGWLTNSTALAATTGANPLSITRFLTDQATLYLLGKKTAQTAPLLAALTGYLAREARRIAAESDSGRLDPPCRLILDEAASICPVPLDEWSSDFGSHGLTLIAAFQSRAQVVNRWGAACADVIANNTGATILHAYGSATADLQNFVTLSGHRNDPVTQRQVPVVSLTQLTTLPRGHVVLWPPESAVTLGRTRPGWKRPDVRAQRRAENQKTIRLTEEPDVTEDLDDPAGDSPRPVPSRDDLTPVGFSRLLRRVTRPHPPRLPDRRARRRSGSAPSPHSPPVPQRQWAVDTHGDTHSLNGTSHAGQPPS